MLNLDQRTIAYVAFIGFCILSSSRDAISEFLFKDDAYRASPIFTLLIYSLVTQGISGIVCLRRLQWSWGFRPVWNLKKEVIWVNVFTLLAFVSYFIAIKSPLGAGLNAFTDYGTAPVFTAIVGALIIGDRLDKWFWLCASLSALAIATLALPRVTIAHFSSAWFVGLVLAIFGSLFSAIYRVHFRILLTSGMPPSAIIFNRLHATTVTLGAVVLSDPHLFRGDLVLQASLIGLFGFCAPLFLMLMVIRRVNIPDLAMLLFAFPALTLLMSAGFGYTRLYWSDLLAGVVMLVGLATYERGVLLRFWSSNDG